MRWLTLLVLLFGVLGPRLAMAFPQPDAEAAYVAGDYQTAFRIWLPLAQNGSPRAQMNIARMLDRGEGVPQDHAAAMEWYRRATEQGGVRDGSEGTASASAQPVFLRNPAHSVIVPYSYPPPSAPIIRFHGGHHRRH